MKKFGILLLFFGAIFFVGCSKEAKSAKNIDPVKGKMFAYTEEVYGVPSFMTIEFGQNKEVTIVSGMLIPSQDALDAVQSIKGTYVYDSTTSSVFIHSNEESAEKNYQVVFTYEQGAKLLSRLDENGAYFALQEIEDTGDDE